MNKSEQIIVQLAETYKKPDEFINILEKLFEVSPNDKGDLLLKVGILLYNFSYFFLALNTWSHALGYFIRNKDKVGESNCYGNLGIAYQSLGNFEKAIEYHEKSLDIFNDIGDRAGESKCYWYLGIAYQSLGNFGKAIEYHDKSLEIFKDIGDRAGESNCYWNLGIAYQSLGNFGKAIEYHEKSLDIFKDIGDRAGESNCYTNLGIAYQSLGNYGKAIEYHDKSLEIKKDIGDMAGESSCYTNLGAAYQSLGNYGKAIEYLEKSLEIAKDIGDRAGESSCYTNLGIAYQSLGDFEKAIEYHDKSLEIFKDIEDRAGESNCYGSLGAAYQSLGDFGKAIEYHDKSLEIFKDIGDRAGESNCYGNLGAAYRSLGDYGKAIEYHEKSLDIKKDIGDIDSERVVSCNLGRIYDESEKPELAYEYYNHSIELSEMMGGRLVEEEHKIGFYARASKAYQGMIPLCFKLDSKEGEAFEYAERSKSRAFLDLIANTEIKPSVELTSELKSLLDDEEKYLSKLREIQMRHLSQTKVSMELGELEGIFRKLDKIYDKIEEHDPEYVFLRRVKPLSLDRVQNLLSSQKRDRDAVLIEYFITRDKTFIFVISSKDNKLHIEPVSISAEKLNRYVEVYWREVVDYHEFQDIGDTWLGLSDYLIEPISEYLCEGDLIYFVPYGLLHYLPIHALELNGEPVIKKHPVAYSPSASLLKFCKNKGSSELKSCVSLGVAFGKNEEAEFEEKLKNMNKEEKEEVEEKIKKVKEIFEGESKDVAGLFSTQSDNGKSATKDKVIEKCTDKDVIHFSCHGYFDYADPLSSGVKLYDSVLTAREIFDMRLNTELVTLSACQTGLNQRSPGDELIGLTRAFIYAGAPSVIVSLWSVDAHSTQELMLEFYKLLKNGSDKATALQVAQKRIMEKAGYSHPYYWAPFVLVGDWE